MATWARHSCPGLDPAGRDLAAAQARDHTIPLILQRMMDRDADWEAAD
jgi:hypothetical protein